VRMFERTGDCIGYSETADSIGNTGLRLHWRSREALRVRCLGV